MALNKTVLFFLIFAIGGGVPSFSRAMTDEAAAKSRLNKIADEIKQAETAHKKLREKAQAAEKEILDVRRRMVSAAGSIQEQEESLSRLEKKLREFESRQTLLKNRLEIRREQRVRVLAALQNLAWKPTEALLLQPLAAEDTLRSALLLREAVPRLENSTEGLRSDLMKVASLTTAIRAQYAQIRTMTKRLEGKRRDMNALLKKKSELQSAFAAESAREKNKAEALAKQAGDLRDLLARLEAESAKRKKTQKKWKKPTAVAFAKTKGRLPYPVKGDVVKKFGEMMEAGVASKGILIRTRPDAQVVSPYDGRVLFAGPFRGYGQLVIIDHDDGFHTLLAGVGRLDTAVGQSLLAGEPVGIMVAQDTPTLYIEVRKNGQPVDPEDFMKQNKG